MASWWPFKKIGKNSPTAFILSLFLPTDAKILNTEYNLKASYGGAELALKISLEGRATLLVNGIARDRSEGAGTLVVSSTVQTDYEWHELIEGRVSISEDQISASLLANKIELAHQDFPVGDLQ